MNERLAIKTAGQKISFKTFIFSSSTFSLPNSARNYCESIIVRFLANSDLTDHTVKFKYIRDEVKLLKLVPFIILIYLTRPS